MALALSAALCGCKERSAPVSATLPPAPVLHAEVAANNALTADPLTNPFWKKVNWSRLVAPVNDTRSTPPTLVASAYDATNLYVAFVCASTEIYAGAPSAKPWENDSVELWLDTAAAPKANSQGWFTAPRAAGCEVFRIVAGAQGQTSAYWYRCAEPPKPKEDGSPNFAHPISMIPVPAAHVPGLQVKTGAGELNGQHVWTAVVCLPLNSLPIQLRTQPQAGAHWHANLIRNDWIKTADGTRELLQSNFSPVYQSAQAVSPYRMADLVLDDANGPVLTLRAGN